MGLFSKKYCDICGEKIGLFGNRKLEDGNICSHCADQLSPWFDDRRHSTLEEIRDQLAYREENRQKVRNFHCSLDLGENYHVLFDEQAGTFLVVTASQKDRMETVNPDVFSLSQVKDAVLDISDTRSELYTTDREGNRESYDPPRYCYRYRFYLEITLDHPYVDQIRFQLNEYPVEIEHTDRGFSLFTESFTPERDYDYRNYQSMGQDIVRYLKRPLSQKKEEEDGQPDMMYCPNCGQRIRKARFCTNCGAEL